MKKEMVRIVAIVLSATIGIFAVGFVTALMVTAQFGLAFPPNSISLGSYFIPVICFLLGVLCIVHGLFTVYIWGERKLLSPSTVARVTLIRR